MSALHEVSFFDADTYRIPSGSSASWRPLRCHMRRECRKRHHAAGGNRLDTSPLPMLDADHSIIE